MKYTKPAAPYLIFLGVLFAAAIVNIPRSNERVVTINNEEPVVTQFAEQSTISPMSESTLND